MQYQELGAIPKSLLKKELALGITVNTGVESSHIPIHEHNELQLQLSLRALFNVFASVVRRSISYYLIIEGHPQKAAYQTHCHGIVADLTQAEQDIVECLWLWYYANDEFIDARDNLLEEQQKKYRLKWAPPSVHFKEDSPVERTLSYALKGHKSNATLTTISAIAVCNSRLNQMWYKEAKAKYKKQTSIHWHQLMVNTARTGTKIGDLTSYCICYILSSEAELNTLKSYKPSVRKKKPILPAGNAPVSNTT